MKVSQNVFHTKGMTLAQAEERFVSDCFQDRATAKQHR